ncbi:3,2-trans-enoyl-CoA isomerase [Daphnia magna]|uniref:3,2-trans-enoyl-CoA isomerase n=1 Tax=Daphnia magna TaxID=35525 RepID=A0A164LPV9_9CRUS|nr:3,2-trans-enoyl-CoA isomerase [Daphnia magna]
MAPKWLLLLLSMVGYNQPLKVCTTMYNYCISHYLLARCFLIYITTLGHAPAGGCLLAMCCDSRIMVNGKSKIGLNETKLGIVAPFWFKDTFVNTIGVRQSERALQLGSLFTPDEALKIGLVDRVLPDPEAATAVAESELKEFLQIPAMARYLSKMRIREAALKDLLENREKDLNTFVNFATTDAVQKGLGIYLQSLAKKN